MKGEIDSSFTTAQRDLFLSGLAAKVGAGAHMVWTVLKIHSGYSTGQCWPGVRRIAELSGMGVASVHRAIKTLEEHRMLRIAEKGSGKKTTRYIPREILHVRIGKRTICVVAVDYVPSKIRSDIEALTNGLDAGDASDIDDDVLARCSIYPGEGFVWNADRRALEADIPASELPMAEDEVDSFLTSRVRAIQDMARSSVDK